MSLNQDALNEYQDLDHPTDGTDVTLVTTVQKTYDEPTQPTVASVVAEKVSALAEGIKVVAENGEKVVDLEQVAQNVETAQAVSRDDADAVVLSVESLFDGVPRASFTQVRSKSNFQHTVRQIGKEKVLALESLGSSVAVLFDVPVNDALDLLQKTEEVYLPALRHLLLNLQDVAVTLKDSLQKNPNLVVPAANSEFVDLRDVSINAFKIEEVRFSQVNTQQLKQAVDNYQSLVRVNTPLAKLVASAYQNLPVDKGDVLEGLDLTVSAWVDLLQPGRLDAAWQEVDAQVRDARQKLVDLQELASKLAPDAPTGYRDFVVHYGVELQMVGYQIGYLSNQVHGLTQLLPNLEVILTTLSSLS